MMIDLPHADESQIRQRLPMRRHIMEQPVRFDYAIFLGLLLLSYVAINSVVLVRTDFLPYVYDNNESFSSLWHAENLYNFGTRDSVGLTDEAFSPHPEAHPYVHTHQGNFPRLFAFLIYILGIRAIESQILVTTFTVGIAALWMSYHFLSRITSPLYAFVACAFFFADYLQVVQWQTVTYRLWHFFFVFSSLLCVSMIGSRYERLGVILTVLNFTCLFYYELVFVIFAATFSFLYGTLLYLRRPRAWLMMLVSQASGAVISIIILLSQLLAYLGWQGLVTDIYITYIARNYASSDSRLENQIDDFYDMYHVVFWHNIVDSERFRSLSAFFAVNFEYVIQLYTPLLTLIAFTVVVGFLLGLTGHPSWLRWSVARMLPDAWNVELVVTTGWLRGSCHGILSLPPVAGWVAQFRSTPRSYVMIASLSLLALAMAFLMLTVVRDQSFAGFPVVTTSFTALFGIRILLGILLMAVLGSLVLVSVARALVPSGRAIHPGRVVLSALFLAAVGQAIRIQARYYRQDFQPVWRETLLGLGAGWVERGLLAIAIVLAVMMILVGTRQVLGTAAVSRLRGLATYLVSGTIAYIVAYLAAPGYVYSGYLVRSAPLAVFVIGFYYALALVIVTAATGRLVRLTLSRETKREGALRSRLSPAVSGEPIAGPAAARMGLGAAALAVGALLTGVGIYWVSLSFIYMQLVPPTHFAFLKLLREPPYYGASFVSNGYVAPVANFTNQWAYMDHTFSRGEVQLTEHGYVPRQELSTYLWLADKRENPAYRRPHYFICIRPQALSIALSARAENREFLEEVGCSDVPIVQKALVGDQPYLKHRVVAADQGMPMYWAILELDWNFPPYLLPLEDDGPTTVRLTPRPVQSGISVTVDYRYAQQEGEPEAASLVRLYATDQTGALFLLHEASGVESIELPSHFQGTIRASVVPRTATKAGPEYFGDPLIVGMPVVALPPQP